MFGDPEELYREMVSGNSAALRADAESVTDAIKKITEASTRVREAVDGPKWDSGSAAAYWMQTRGVSQGIAVTSFALKGTQIALRKSAKAYDVMDADATEIIKDWRDKGYADNSGMALLGGIFYNMRRIQVRATYEEQLSAAHTFLTAKDTSAKASKGDKDTARWLKEGRKQLADWLRHTGSLAWPYIPNLYDGDSTDGKGQIPQRLTYDAETGLLIQTSYSNDDEPSRMTYIDPVTGEVVSDVELGGPEAKNFCYNAPNTPDHAGGVAVHDGKTYVTSSTTDEHPSGIVVYDNDDLKGGANGPVKGEDYIPFPPDGSSESAAYMTMKDGKMYVGTHSEKGKGRLYCYTKQNGEWAQDKGFGGDNGYAPAPEKAQGLVVRDGEYIFSASLGRKDGSPSHLIVQDPKTGDTGEPYELPRMAEGIANIDGTIYTTYESAAEKYGPHGEGKPRGGFLWMGTAFDELWASDQMTKTDVDDLDRPGRGSGRADFEVDTATLRATAREFDTAEGPLKRAASDVAGIWVDSGDFGEVPGAGTLATTLNEAFTEIEDSLDRGVVAVRRTGNNLRANAANYDESDLNSRARINTPKYA